MAFKVLNNKLDEDIFELYEPFKESYQYVCSIHVDYIGAAIRDIVERDGFAIVELWEVEQ